MGRTQTDHRGRVARDGSLFLGDAKRSATGVFGAQFLGVARQSPPRGRPQANRCRHRSPIVKERQLTGLKRPHNQMAGSGRPPTVSTHSRRSRFSEADAPNHKSEHPEYVTKLSITERVVWFSITHFAAPLGRAC